VVEIIVYP